MVRCPLIFVAWIWIWAPAHFEASREGTQPPNHQEVKGETNRTKQPKLMQRTANMFYPQSELVIAMVSTTPVVVTHNKG